MHRIKQFALRRKTALIRMTAIVLAVCGSVAMLSQSAFAQNTYMITDGDRVTYHTSYATDPNEVLDEAGFELGKDDTYTTQESDGVSEIYVQRQTQVVTVDNGGQVMSVGTQGETVRQLLTRVNVTVDPQTTVSEELDSMTEDGMQIVVSRTTYATETYTQTIPYEVTQLNDASLQEGRQQVLTAGSDGEMLCTAQVTYVNGVEQEREVVTSATLKEATTTYMYTGTTPRPKTASNGYYIWPVSGTITSGYGYRYIFGAYSWHSGIDIAAPYGTVVKAADGGTVTFAGWRGSYGKLVIITHDDGSQTYYAHNSSFLVKAGDKVYQGQPICKIGLTGTTTGYHLHFEIRINGKTVNPRSYLP